MRRLLWQFPGLDAGARYNNAGFWDLPIPVTKDVEVFPNDIVYYDEEGYPPLRAFLKSHGVRHVILTGYATDMCFCKTTAGYENLFKTSMFSSSATRRWRPFRRTIRLPSPRMPTSPLLRSTS